MQNDVVIDEALGRGRIYDDGAAANAPDSMQASPHDRASRAFVAELVELMGRPTGEPSWRAELPNAEVFGRTWAEAGVPAPDLVRAMGRLSRALEDTMDSRHLLGEGARRRLRELADESVSRAIGGHQAVTSERRDGWLSYFSHELRNPLNTIVNAIWLLRTGDQTGTKTGNSQRICDMAERATKRLESTIREVRALETSFGRTPPAKGPRLPTDTPPAPPGSTGRR